jgi:hypothetical protein
MQLTGITTNSVMLPPSFTTNPQSSETMKKNCFTIIVTTILLFIAGGTTAQSGFVVTGATVYGSTHEVSYSAGNIAYRQMDGATASILSGLQVPAGCTDINACNYDPNMVVDDGSCLYGNCPGVEGCTNEGASNYNPNASVDDGSCLIGGCKYPAASNYNPSATIDDGSCLFDESCATDFNNDGSTGISDLLFFISYYGTICE